MKIRMSLPDQEQLEMIDALSEQGLSAVQISMALWRNNHNADLVREYLRSPESFDTYVDWVAVDRALTGDRRVWENLTHYERREAVLRWEQAPEWVRLEVWGLGRPWDIVAKAVERGHAERVA